MRFSTAFLVGVVCLSAATPARAEVLLRIENGQVSLKATNATVRDILAEWARIGQTKVVNGDRVPGGPVSLELTGVTEEQALEVILRSVAGYVVAPRAVGVPNASMYDRILVMPTSTPTSPAPPPQRGFAQPGFAQPGMPQPFQPPQFPGQAPGQFPPQFPPQFPQPRPVGDDDDLQDDPAPNVVLPNPGSPAFGVMPTGTQPPPGGPGFGARPPAGQVPVGVSTPGMIVPAPQPQPGQPGAIPGRPDQPF